MKSRKTWLHTAVRAHQAKTLDQMERTREAWDELFDAEQAQQQSSRRLDALSQDWGNQRRVATGGQQIDAMYLRFHEFLSEEAVRAERAQVACQQQADAAVAELTQVHAVQRTLEKVAQHKKEQVRRAATAQELQSNAEAWLLGRIASGISHAERDVAAVSPKKPAVGGEA